MASFRWLAFFGACQELDCASVSVTSISVMVALPTRVSSILETVSVTVSPTSCSASSVLMSARLETRYVIHCDDTIAELQVARYAVCVLNEVNAVVGDIVDKRRILGVADIVQRGAAVDLGENDAELPVCR